MAGNKLDTVIKLAKKEEKDALLIYQKIHQNYLSEVEKLKQLELFRLDYARKIHVGREKNVEPQILQNYFKFIAQLDQLIVQQIKQNKQAERRDNEVKKEYLKLKIKTDSLEKIVEAQQEKNRKAREKMEQKENDEYAQNQWYSREQDH